MPNSNWSRKPLVGFRRRPNQYRSDPAPQNRSSISVFPYAILRNFMKHTHAIMQAALTIISVSVFTAILGTAVAVPEFDFIPSYDWILGEPTVLDPVEESLENQSLDQEYPYDLDSAQYGPADLDPSIFQATPPDPAFIGPVQPDPTVFDPTGVDPALADPNDLDPALLDPNDPESHEMSLPRPNCGNGRFGPNVPLCCNGLMSPGGAVVSGCEWFDRGKRICKNTDNVVCCQFKAESLGFACWRFY